MCFLSVVLRTRHRYDHTMFMRVYASFVMILPRLSLYALIALGVMPNCPMALASTDLPHATVRLINGGLIGKTTYAGVEITMDAHVKTYWRMPGDSGLPPVFDWSTSDNLADAQVKWPLPERIADPSGTIFGYHDQVIFPVLITAKDPSKPVRLGLKLDFAICGELCVPMADKASLLLKPETENTSDRERLETFLNRVPAPSIIGQSDRPSLVSIESKAPDTLLVAANRPLSDIIVEAPNGWYFGDATAQSAILWNVKLLEKPTKATLAGLSLTVTLVAEGQATETSLSLDASGSIR